MKIVSILAAIVFLLFNAFFKESFESYSKNTVLSLLIVFMFVLLSLGPVTQAWHKLKRGLKSYRLAYNNREFLFLPEKDCRKSEEKIALNDVSEISLDFGFQRAVLKTKDGLFLCPIVEMKSLESFLDSLSLFQTEVYNARTNKTADRAYTYYASTKIYKRDRRKSVLEEGLENRGLFDAEIEVKNKGLYEFTKKLVIATFLIAMAGLVITELMVIAYFLIPLVLVVSGLNQLINKVGHSSYYAYKSKLVPFVGVFSLVCGIILLLVYAVVMLLILLL